MLGNVLVVMAAGIGSRYGGGIKQLEPVGPSGEIIMDYSVYDAIEAGFRKVIFIIRKDLEKDFKEVIGSRISSHIQVEYAFQELTDLPAGYKKPKGRTKPWGTGQAVLCCMDKLKEPFAVINADDYYGKEAFHVIHQFLSHPVSSGKKHQYCMAGFKLGNTLSENGTVTRGVCHTDQNGKLIKIKETYGVRRNGDAATSEDGEKIPLDCPVSMNMWGYTPDFLDELKKRFCTFLDQIPEGSLTAEFLLPNIMAEMLAEGDTEIAVLNSNDKWFGVTYKEDKEMVAESFRRLVAKGVYPARLF